MRRSGGGGVGFCSLVESFPFDLLFCHPCFCRGSREGIAWFLL
ncbi:hypothetical protein SLEP1_g13251 [Rubroshorea leprosula]|uniref:Uncharacterized protein n=1 Tax=Rubroshorea leprosula TaxID=152421 RepID=A0AAV5IL31_9ROSI|nr:hypothetical protein SLEP1_g13251 [Rubroshorea leprosula]